MRQRCLWAVVLICYVGSAAQAQTIYKQDVFALQGFSSTYDPTAIFAFLAADNFSIGSAATVGQVRWWGNSDEFGSTDLTNFTEFTLTLHQRTGAGTAGRDHLSRRVLQPPRRIRSTRGS